MKKILFLITMLASASFVRADEQAAKLALAREVITAVQADKMFDSMAAQMKQMAAQMAPAPSGANPEQLKILEKFQGQIMDRSMSEARGMIAKLDRVYADVYSEAELKAIKAFFNSPEGQSMVAKQPEIMQHLMPLIQDMQRGLMPQIQKLAEEMKLEMAKAATKPAAAPAAK